VSGVCRKNHDLFDADVHRDQSYNGRQLRIRNVWQVLALPVTTKAPDGLDHGRFDLSPTSLPPKSGTSNFR
jgi:hypothetical protein